MNDSGRELSDDDITQAEQQLGVTFPPPYRDFLKRHNGGHPEPDGFPVGDDDESTLQEFYGIDDSPSLLVEEVAQIRQIERIPRNYLPIANDGMANSILLVTDGPETGKLYFWDHGAHPDDMFTELAPDLEGFLATFFD